MPEVGLVRVPVLPDVPQDGAQLRADPRRGRRRGQHGRLLRREAARGGVLGGLQGVKEGVGHHEHQEGGWERNTVYPKL